MPLTQFHPVVAAWFAGRFTAPTAVQGEAWPAIQSGRHALIAAPTGSGKTLAAFLAAIDTLVRQGVAHGLAAETHVLYVSPLKALSNDIQKNLQEPLLGIRERLLEHGLADVDIRAWVRTGDTPQSERARMRRQPPHIIVTTPESLYILLTSESGREMLKTVRTVIVDEIHALAGNKRGAHLTLSLERLATLCATPPVRIGLSATQKPIDTMARFLTGDNNDCAIIDSGHVRRRDLALEVTGSPLEAVMSNEAWQEIYNRLAELVHEHRTTLIFVNTRRLAERAARFLAERLGEEHVTAHHGSLAREHRLDAEQRLKRGQLKALVATASLELGIDIGEVDLVCQLGSPHTIAALLQRVGRSGHGVHALPKGRLFPLSRDDLVECTALLDAVRHDELDRIVIPEQPLDVLAQQIVAEVASRDWSETELYDALKQAWPYRALTRETFVAITHMLADGFSTRRGRRSAYLHRDAVHGQLRARRGARLTAITNGGAIPDQFDYDVVLSPDGFSIGSVNEDFAFESLPGDIFQLGNISYRILKIELGKLYVEDAKGQPPNIPFWLGEAPGRSDELSLAVSRLRAQLAEQLERGMSTAQAWLQETMALPPAAAQQLVDYLATAKAALGTLPTQDTVVFERFFDENGDMHLVIHAPFGSRINRAWGLSLRKRFCRKFNFELQAAATEDNVVLSLGPTHSFPLDEVAGYLHAGSVRQVLIQALLAAPMFATRWRWNASIALAVKRQINGKRRPAQFQRSDAEDLVAVIFPDQLACLENIAGDREVPNHPLVNQTLTDCLHVTMDIDGLERVLRRLERGELQVITRDLATPSPLAQEILNARPYAFLDDAPIEERRTLVVQQRRFLDPQSAADIGRLDPAAINKVKAEVWPEACTEDELHDGLNVLGFMTEAEGQHGPLNADPRTRADWTQLLNRLSETKRATCLTTSRSQRLWVAAERLSEVLAVFPDATLEPAITPPTENVAAFTTDEAMRELVRSRLEGLGPVTAAQLAAPLEASHETIMAALLTLEQEGFAIQGQFDEDAQDTQWCERGLLARIHRYTLKQLRSEIEPVAAADFMRFLFHWQRLDDKVDGEEALASILEQLEGVAVPAGAWESAVLPARMDLYLSQWLDNLCHAGRIVWRRPNVSRDKASDKRKAAPVRMTPITLMSRPHIGHWGAPFVPEASGELPLSSAAAKVLTMLQKDGASFFVDLVHATGLLRTQVEDALGELVAWGLITADSFAGLRALITPQHRRPGYGQPRHRRRNTVAGVDAAGRWALLTRTQPASEKQARHATEGTEHIARILLKRYGVVFRKLLDREAGLPPWRELLYIYRRLEARGELRGGRFVQGFSGEQFALPEAVGTLRDIRKRDKDGDLIAISATDPLNLTGIITPGPRVSAQATNRILYRDGVPLAISLNGEVSFADNVDTHDQWAARNLLLREQGTSGHVRHA